MQDAGQEEEEGEGHHSLHVPGLWLEPLQLLLCVLTVCCVAVIYTMSGVLGNNMTWFCVKLLQLLQRNRYWYGRFCLFQTLEGSSAPPPPDESPAHFLPSTTVSLTPLWSTWSDWDPVRPQVSARESVWSLCGLQTHSASGSSNNAPQLPARRQQTSQNGSCKRRNRSCSASSHPWLHEGAGH